jgi:hypothetical protein
MISSQIDKMPAALIVVQCLGLPSMLGKEIGHKIVCLNPTYWTCPGCHVGRAVHLAAGILVLQVPLVIAITSLFYIDLWLIVVYIV